MEVGEWYLVTLSSVLCLCSSVCFRNVWVLACASALGKKKGYFPDREVSLIKKEYCRLSVTPLPASDRYSLEIDYI